jgi:hypothetical protein
LSPSSDDPSVESLRPQILFWSTNKEVHAVFVIVLVAVFAMQW